MGGEMWFAEIHGLRGVRQKVEGHFTEDSGGNAPYKAASIGFSATQYRNVALCLSNFSI
jgi:hypothetical protein